MRGSPNATVACTLRYDPWGNTIGGSPCNTGTTWTTTLYRQTRQDTSTGTYQWGNRNYDPRTANWLTADNTRGGGAPSAGSIGTDPLTANGYAYVNGDPINLEDPTGHYGVGCPDGVCRSATGTYYCSSVVCADYGMDGPYDAKRRAISAYVNDPDARQSLSETEDSFEYLQKAVYLKAAMGVDYAPEVQTDWLLELIAILSGADDINGCLDGNKADCAFAVVGLFGVGKLRHVDDVIEVVDSIHDADKAHDGITIADEVAGFTDEATTAGNKSAPRVTNAVDDGVPSTGSGAALPSGARPLAELAPPSTVNNAASPIRSFVTAEDQTFYRVFSGDRTVGSFLTGARPASAADAVRGLALPPGNQAGFIQEVLVPGGTRLQSSIAAEAFGQPGGMLQFELLEHIPVKNFGPGVPFL